MKRVVIESPYAGTVEQNLAYARRCIVDSLRRGESPYASHLLFTQPGILDDLKSEERALGIRAGFAWGDVADLVAVYTDRGVSRGMVQGIERAADRPTPTPIVWRSLHCSCACLACRRPRVATPLGPPTRPPNHCRMSRPDFGECRVGVAEEVSP